MLRAFLKLFLEFFAPEAFKIFNHFNHYIFHQECWRLYEKMKKTGLNVSYDTILRGILKPSELRLLEKQKKYLGDIDEKPGDGNEVQPEPQRVN